MKFIEFPAYVARLDKKTDGSLRVMLVTKSEYRVYKFRGKFFKKRLS